jgi:hypothetical protein
MGVCVSGKSVERLKKHISDDAIDVACQWIASGQLFYVIFDNINIYVRKFQQRITNKNTMIHATNSAVIAINDNDLDVNQAEELGTKLQLRGKRADASWEDIQNWN